MGKFKKKVGDSKISGDFSALEKIVEGIDEGYYVDIGIIGAGQHEGSELTIAEVGAANEFGTLDKRVPERSFIRMPLQKKGKEIEKKIGEKAEALIAKGEIKKLFELIGIAGEGAIQEAFDSGGFGTWPDIADSTKKRKGSSAILIDKGVLRKSIISKVGKGKK